MSIFFLMGILLVLSDLIHFALTCSSRSTNRERPPNWIRSNVTNATYPCLDDSAEIFCQNSGICFTLSENSTDYLCKCMDGYCGATCSDQLTQYGCFSSSSALTMATEELFERPADTFPCPEGPSEWLCLNGGSCFTVFENGSDYACLCPEGYCGLRCAEKYTRYGCFSTYLVISASVAGASCMAVCFVALVIAVYVFYEKKISVKDDELITYLQQNAELRIFSRALSASKLDNLKRSGKNFEKSTGHSNANGCFMDGGSKAVVGYKELPNISCI